ncbi:MULTISPECIES: acyl-CoA dehydrogenase family protein [Sphingobacterium]|uniref:acyl-CoA dehydrogenase family protein n=1 Tax=Sphingobacterium TaxID=28453 RepID=UPI0013DD7916|nr:MULTISPECIES: acyl-CoA dehydrogenase family protein [unclassified Sphingobacterium]
MNSSVDYFNLDELLEEEHLLVRQTVRDFVRTEILPSVDAKAQQHEEIPDLMKKLGGIGALGPFVSSKYGGAGLDYLAYGLIMQELEAGDSAIRSAASVQSSLVMYPIYTFGSEAQRNKYLPMLATGDWVGAFGLTEPNHGSDPSSMETRIKKDREGYRLTGTKTWITNAPICDVAVVWARDEQGKIKGVIIERDDVGFSTPEIKNKWSLRASRTGELVFDQVYIPRERILPEVSSMRGPLSCLNSARYGISWGVIGAAIDCYQVALRYALERTQFGKPIASYQLQQKKLAEIITEITKAQLLSWRLGVLKNESRATPQQISMAKRNNVDMALRVARESRQILGAMGIVGDYPIMRHMMNLESVITYEGTHDIHLLITGQDITGISSF